MIVTTIDPVTGNKVTDLEHHPFVVEGSGVAAMKIYFESGTPNGPICWHSRTTRVCSATTTQRFIPELCTT